MLILSVLFPLLAGALLPLFRFKSGRARGVYVMAATLVTSLCILPAVFGGGKEQVKLFEITEYLPVAFKLDGAGRVFTAIVSLLWPLCSLYALEYMEEEEHHDLFFSFYTMCYGVTLGISCAANLVTLYLFYELLTLVTLPLVMHGGGKESVRAGLKYLYYSIGGAALAFIGLIFVIYYGGTTQFQYGGIPALGAAEYAPQIRIGYLVCFIGFSVKAAVFPLHGWLPAASVAPTPVTALLHAVAVVKSGVFAIIRVTWFVFGFSAIRHTYAQHIPLALAAFTIVYGCTMALKEQHLKRRLAYSTVSNLSYILFGALLMTESGLYGGLMHMVYHAAMKITLFMAAGILLQRGCAYVPQMRGIHRAAPVMTAVFALASLAMTGIPPLLGFSSKWQLAEAGVLAGSRLGAAGVVALIISATLTAFYLVVPTVSAYASAPARGLAPGEMEPGWRVLIPLAVLSAAMLFISFYPAPLTAFLKDAAAGLL